MKRFMQTLTLVLGLAVLLAPLGVGASGYENIGGQSGYRVYYGNPRTITNPAAAGPAVAFYQMSSGRVDLGAHNCNGTLYQYNYMEQYSWKAVWDTSTPDTVFCLWHNAAPAGWYGDLNWD